MILPRCSGCVLVALLATGPLRAQQVADSSFAAAVAHPVYGPGKGPLVAIDEAHFNFHTRTGRYLGFTRLLEHDGYRVTSNTAPFTRASLDSLALLVIANAIGGVWDAGAYGRPGFTDAEADAVRDWVTAGGNLLLIADHAPMGVAAENLAARFGVSMGKGFTEDSTSYFRSGSYGPSILLYTRAGGLLRGHLITQGRDSSERVDSVVAFTGQSLGAPAGAEVILALSDQAVDHPSPTPEQAATSPNPGSAWRTAVQGLPTHSARGRVQGLALRVGKGRVVMLGEAAMLSAQVVLNPSGQPVGRMGMNVPGIGNRQFALNLVHWLTGVLR
ncbi:MAG TPA: DUF4350 domain-containing protein [Gemmatimonadales bacterium]|nr:DUF4350 domain-containing protein [Gemmatimonadales bacterium]